MNDNESILIPIIRHTLQFVGAGAVFSGDELNMIVGGIVSLIAVSWGICKRRGYSICNTPKKED